MPQSSSVFHISRCPAGRGRRRGEVNEVSSSYRQKKVAEGEVAVELVMMDPRECKERVVTQE